jgi:CTP:molybdopterin cytidylyltransferase MocA
VIAPAALAVAAACSGVMHQAPTHRLGPFRAPLVVGDSVTAEVRHHLAATGFEVDARVCRQWDEGSHLVFRRALHHTLPHEVVMFLGANWHVTPAQLRHTLQVIGPRRLLVLVTPVELGGRDGPDAHNERVFARLHPHRVLLLDWARLAIGHHSWFGGDGLHLHVRGARALVRLIARALPFAAPGRFP